MNLIQTIRVFTLCCLCSSVYAVNLQAKKLDTEIQKQYVLSIEHILSNLPHQSNTYGSVAASPSKEYQYHWTRDAALTWQSLLSVYQDPSQSSYHPELFRRFYAWVLFEKQAIQNAWTIGLSQGEPKFHLDSKPYTGAWGRPQNDGPALRALTMSYWALQLIKEGQIQFVLNELYQPELPARSIIKSDLEFTSRNWKVSSYDLWEEIKGLNFYTLAMQRKSLLVGAILARTLHDPEAAQYYEQTALQILTLMQSFSDPRGYIVAVRQQVDGWTHKKSQLDAAVVLATIQGPLDLNFFQFQSNELQNTVDELEKNFRQLYPINRNQQTPVIGRYPEDVYDGFGFSGGNPWFLTTHAYAEYYCKLAVLYPHDQKLYLEQGRKYLKRVLKHRNQQTGEMSEQIHRQSGYLTGVSHLTWSYASFITAVKACFP